MKIALSALVLAALAGTASAELTNDLVVGNQGLSLNRSFPIGQRWQNVDRGAAGFAYENLTNFGGSGITNGGATAGSNQTTVIADDLTSPLSTVGEHVLAVQFTVANFNTAATAARPRLRLWASDGAGGGPGTLLVAVTFNPISFPGGSVNTFTYQPGPILFALNGTTTQTVWAGLLFDAVGTTTTFGAINNLGQGLFDPPVTGTSADVSWESAATGSNAANNPAGGFFSFGGDPIANLGYSLFIPAPGSVALLGLGGLIVGRRRR